MGRRTHYSFKKRQKEIKKREKAQKKRERRLAKKRGVNEESELQSGDQSDDSPFDPANADDLGPDGSGRADG